MRTPVRSVPPSIGRWTTRARALRWADALAGAAVVWLVVATGLPTRTVTGDLVIVLVLLGVAAVFAPLRRRWRPVSAAVGVAVSRGLRPGDHAWYVRADGVERVLVTARGANRIVIATARPDASEGVTVRRTRVLLIPAG